MDLRLNNDLKSLQVGDYFWCHYSATNNQVGVFSDLATKTDEEVAGLEIPPQSSVTPNGYFKYIVVDRDRKGNPKLVADRNIQHSISWDELNTKGVASGSGIETPLVEPWEYIKNQHLTVSGQWMTRIDHRSYNNNSYYRGIRYPKGRRSGKWYYEVSSIKTGSTLNWFRTELGVADKSQSLALNNTSSSSQMGWDHRLGFNRNSDEYSYGETMGVMIDLDEKKLHLYQNGVIIHSRDGLPDGELYPFIAIKDEAGVIINLGVLPFKYDLPEGYSPYVEQDNYLLTTRLLTGGTSSSDKDNEWDKYIVESDLDGTITAGDNNVWNWGNADGTGNSSWTSTTPTGTNAANKVNRGQGAVANLSGWYSGLPTRVNNWLGFRPVLIIESVGFRHFVYSDNIHYTYDNGIWQPIGENPTQEDYEKYGMYNEDLQALTKADLLTLPNLSSGKPKVRTFKYS